MSPLRVALVHGRADPAHDGVADYTVHLADALDRRGLDVVDVPVDPGVRGLLRAARLLRASRADVAHVQFAPSAFGFSGAPGLLGDLAGRPLVTTLHEYGWWSWAPRVPARVWSFLERRRWADRETGRLVPRSAAVLTTNGEHATTLADRCGVASRRAPLLPNVEVSPDAPDRVATRRALGVPEDAELVVFFGFVHPVKGLRYLADAVAKLAAERPRVHLLILGGFTSLALPADEAEAFRAELAGQIAEAGAADRVTITGHRPAGEVSAALQAADVAAFPFTAGATLKSGALLAALDHQLPTLVTRRPDAPEDPDLVDGETVVVARQVRDAEVLVDGLRRLLGDDALRERVAAGGHELVRGQSWDTLAALHVEVYREVTRCAASS
ncbi:glycosyltransferase family 4 protein [Actinomycetospora cinnamomea]|uniref:Glycosyltransferase involved in cell wall biosynthesis n=1 Tax=Actinomycetospora cinnamomea TaxID=663609 RepID=A0A2U1FLA9_9PSEU|nr:glycosyltransferase family 4 protein [Actinomycetospora cinnamomea]PVZ12902.1 glycosyltransferase involved in cell wall biosynthesis [Actinomycetospora cinnamomea]